MKVHLKANSLVSWKMKAEWKLQEIMMEKVNTVFQDIYFLKFYKEKRGRGCFYFLGTKVRK